MTLAAEDFVPSDDSQLAYLNIEKLIPVNSLV